MGVRKVSEFIKLGLRVIIILHNKNLVDTIVNFLKYKSKYRKTRPITNCHWLKKL